MRDLVNVFVTDLAALKVDTFCRFGALYQALAKSFAAKRPYPGTGSLASLLFVDLVDIFSVSFDISFFGKRSDPNWILDFQTIIAEVDAIILLSPRRPALSRWNFVFQVCTGDCSYYTF